MLIHEGGVAEITAAVLCLVGRCGLYSSSLRVWVNFLYRTLSNVGHFT